MLKYDKGHLTLNMTCIKTTQCDKDFIQVLNTMMSIQLSMLNTLLLNLFNPKDNRVHIETFIQIHVSFYQISIYQSSIDSASRLELETSHISYQYVSQTIVYLCVCSTFWIRYVGSLLAFLVWVK